MHATATHREGMVHEVEIDGHRIVLDEPLDQGGTDTAPSPTRLVTAALAGCTAMTIRLYAARKEWSVDGLVVDVDFGGAPRAGESARFDVVVTLPDGLDEAQRERIMVIAGKCPVHRILAGGADVVTTERGPGG
ncbi:MAG: OsmC family protein [Solirubrobacterales bacterium]|nr:OsmC family protein [Solirubrobacterales bacterium]